MAVQEINEMTAADAAKVTGAAKIEIEDSDGNSKRTDLATARTKMLAGGTGFTAADPLVCGTITPSGLIDASGAAAGQVKFPATQNASANANTLDDYEEGTCTLGISFGAATTGITYTDTAGTYTKIGNVVIVRGYVALSSKGSATGGARITGLPFASAAGLSNAATCVLELSGVTYTGYAFGRVEVGAAAILPRYVSEAGSVSAMDDTNFSNASSIMFTLIYVV